MIISAASPLADANQLVFKSAATIPMTQAISTAQPTLSLRRRFWLQEDPADLALAVCMLVFAVSNVVTMAITVRRAYSVLPWGDMWDYWAWYLNADGHLLSRLFAQHNEHRIAVARLFFLVDQKLFHARAIFIFASIFVVQFLQAVLLVALARIAQPDRKTTRLFLGSAAFICVFSAAQYTNFTWSFQIQFVLVYFATTAALAALMPLAVDRPLRRWRWLSAALVMGVIASYSMANGLFVWPFLLLAGFWFGLRRRELLILACVGAGIWVLYLHGYTTPPQHASIRDGFHNLPQSFAYAMCALGSPLDSFVSSMFSAFSVGGEDWRTIWSAAAGLIGFVLALFLYGWFLRNRRQTSRADIVLLHMMLFVVITALLIGLGRGLFPLANSLESRYTTPALLFWFCILFLFASLLRSRAPAGSPLLSFRFAVFVVLLLVVGLYQPTRLVYARGAATYLREVEAAMSAPVYDQQLWGRIYYNPRALIPTVRYFQTHRLSMFATPRYRWVGDTISAHYRVLAGDRCTGFFDDATVINDAELPGIKLRGWAWDTKLHKIATGVVFADNQGRIAGFGYTGFDRGDVRAARPDITSYVTGWTGYLAGGMSGGTLKPGVAFSGDVNAYMLTDGGRSACPIGSRTLPPVVSTH